MALAARAAFVALAAIAGAGCSDVARAPDAGAVVDPDAPAARRAELEASLEDRDNAYARLRLARYATGAPGDWDALPEWNPPARPAFGVAEETPRALDVDADDLVALGEDAFYRYPVQELASGGDALARGDGARYGFWQDAGRGVGGVVEASLPRGGTMLAVTCSTCHVASVGGALAPGVPNARLDLGRLFVEAASLAGAAGEAAYPEWASRRLAWGPGRLDVSTRAGTEPARIPDLRPVRWLSHLQQDATVTQRSEASLAIRIETLIITSNDAVLRPPRRLTRALAAFVTSLASTLPSRAPTTDAEIRGAPLFVARCAGCHAGEGLTGAPVPLAVVGTDPVLGRSTDRGTGRYRVPSLRGAASRGPLLHDGEAPDLATLFDPARTAPGFSGALHTPGPIAGHTYGLDLDASDREALLAFLATQ